MSFISRSDWKFGEFLRKYWWIELLAVAKVIYFINKGFYNVFVGLLFVLGAIVILWILYRIGLK